MRLFSKAWLITMVFSLVSFSVQAQPGMAGQAPQLTEEQKQIMTQIQQSQMKLAEAEKTIQELEAKVIGGSPALLKQQEELKNKITSIINSGGYDLEAEQKALQGIMTKYKQSGEKPSDAVIADFQKRQQAMQMKRKQAMENPEVQKAFKDFNDEMMKAALKVNPNTETMIEGMKTEFAKLMQLRQKLQQSMAK